MNKRYLFLVLSLLIASSCVLKSSKLETKPFVKIQRDSEDEAVYLVQKASCALGVRVPKGLDRVTKFNFICESGSKNDRMYLLDLMLEKIIDHNNGKLPLEAFILQLSQDAGLGSCIMSKRLADEILRLSEWDAIKGKSKKCETPQYPKVTCDSRANFLVVQVANGNNIFKEYSEVFGKYGYKIEISFAEKVRIMDLASIKQECSLFDTLQNQPYEIVPFDALAYFVISRR